MVKVDQEILGKALAALNKTKELICFVVQLNDAVKQGAIRPDQFKKKVRVTELSLGNQFDINLDWAQSPVLFKQTADDVMSCIINYTAVLCKESYPKSLWVTKEEDEDLYAAQMILKFVRDATGHIKVATKNFAVPFWDINAKYREECFEIKELGIVFNAKGLHGSQFQFTHLGGVTNFLRILDYLIKDLKARLSKQQVLDNKTEKISERGL